MNGFKKFILRGNVVDLAVGLAVGASFNAVVTAIVSNLITPIIGLLGGKTNFNHLSFKIHGVPFDYGAVISAVLSFVIMATVVYFFIVLPMNKLNDFVNSGKKTSDPTTKKCPYCFMEIPAKAHRCPNCTSKLAEGAIPTLESKGPSK